jgi:peptidyl-tRNA hydrolase, PTH1 family
MKLVIGLGNPGKQYEKTRHNIGFVIVNALREHLHGTDWKLSKKFNAEISEIGSGEEKIILAKPMTFMNASGQAVQLIMNFYQLTNKDLIVVHDDKDLKLGEIKIQEDRGHAGHNGIRSLIDHIGTKDFTRVRIGVASDNDRRMQDTSKFVLGKFGLLEKRKVKEIVEKSVETIVSLLHA